MIISNITLREPIYMKGRRGVLIAFEGIDGTGKTTLCLLLKEMLEELGLQVEVFKEPTNETDAGKNIRASYFEGRVSVEKELQWFIEDREWDVVTRILPALNEGKIIFLDRYFLSTACYQGVRKNDDWVSILSMNRERFPEPHLTILFDLDPEVAFSRIHKNRLHSTTFEDLGYLRNVRRLFLEIYHQDKIGNYFLIDSSKDIDEIACILYNQIMILLERKGLINSSNVKLK